MRDNLDYLKKIECGIDVECQNNLTFMCYWNDLVSIEILSLEEFEVWMTKLDLDRMVDNINAHHKQVLEYIAESICPEILVKQKNLVEFEGSIIRTFDGAREYAFRNGYWVLETWEF